MKNAIAILIISASLITAFPATTDGNLPAKPTVCKIVRDKPVGWRCEQNGFDMEEVKFQLPGSRACCQVCQMAAKVYICPLFPDVL